MGNSARIVMGLCLCLMTLAGLSGEAKANHWVETYQASCLGGSKTLDVTCTREGEEVTLRFGCGSRMAEYTYTCHLPEPAPALEIEYVPTVKTVLKYEDGWFLGARFLYVAIPGSASFNGGEAMAGFRHYFPDSGWFLQVDGGAGGGNHSYLVDDDEPDSATAIGTLAVRLGVRPVSWFSASIGLEGLVSGNGTETLMAGGTGVFQVGIQYDIVRVSAWIGAGLSHHSDPVTRITWNGQDVTDPGSLPQHAQDNLVHEVGWEAGLDLAVTGGISLVVELP